MYGFAFALQIHIHSEQRCGRQTQPRDLLLRVGVRGLQAQRELWSMGRQSKVRTASPHSEQKPLCARQQSRHMTWSQAQKSARNSPLITGMRGCNMTVRQGSHDGLHLRHLDEKHSRHITMSSAPAQANTAQAGQAGSTKKAPKSRSLTTTVEVAVVAVERVVLDVA